MGKKISVSIRIILVVALGCMVGCVTTGQKQPGASRSKKPQLNGIGNIMTNQIAYSIQFDLQMKYYKGCGNIRFLELLELKPASIQHKKILDAGDKWSMRLKIDACGTIAVHPIKFELIGVKGNVALSQLIEPAEENVTQPPHQVIDFNGRKWRLGHRQKNKVETVREYVLDGESVHAWTQLLTFMAQKVKITTSDATARLRESFRQQNCPKKDFRLLSEQTDDVIYLRDYSHCRQPTPEINIVRSMSEDGWYYTIIYAMRKKPGRNETNRIVNELKKLPGENWTW